MASLTLRTVKGTPLTNTEIDNNFISLNTAKAETAAPQLTGSVQVRSSGTLELFNSDNSNYMYLQNSGSTGGTNAILRVLHGGVGERTRFDSSGNIGIGTSIPGEKLAVVGAITVSGQATANKIGAGTFDFYTAAESTRILSWGSSGIGGKIGFWTGIGGSGALERMQLDGNGNVLVNQAGTGAFNSNSIGMGPTTGGIDISHISGTASGVMYARFNLAAVTIGSITQSGTTAVLYNTTSDARLKTNVMSADDSGPLIDAVQVRQFDWLADGSHQRYGFVAQELAAVVPEAVYQPTGQDEMMAVDYSKLVPLLVKEIQTLRTRVAQLEQQG